MSASSVSRLQGARGHARWASTFDVTCRMGAGMIIEAALFHTLLRRLAQLIYPDLDLAFLKCLFWFSICGSRRNFGDHCPNDPCRYCVVPGISREHQVKPAYRLLALASSQCRLLGSPSPRSESLSIRSSYINRSRTCNCYFSKYIKRGQPGLDFESPLVFRHDLTNLEMSDANALLRHSCHRCSGLRQPALSDSSGFRPRGSANYA